MERKFGLIFLSFCFFGCDVLGLDIEGYPCTPAPEFACVEGYSCRWVSGNPVCLANGAENPDPFLYAENFDDGVADGFTFRVGTNDSWNITGGTLNLNALGGGSRGWIENQEWAQISVQLKFKITAIETYSSLRILFAHGISESTVGEEYYGCGFGFDPHLNTTTFGDEYHIIGSQGDSSCQSAVTFTPEEWYTLQAEFERNHITCRLVEKNIQLEQEFSDDLVFTQTGTFEVLAYQGNYSIDDLVIYSERLPSWPNFPVSCDNP